MTCRPDFSGSAFAPSRPRSGHSPIRSRRSPVRRSSPVAGRLCLARYPVRHRASASRSSPPLSSTKRKRSAISESEQPQAYGEDEVPRRRQVRHLDAKGEEELIQKPVANETRRQPSVEDAPRSAVVAVAAAPALRSGYANLPRAQPTATEEASFVEGVAEGLLVDWEA